MGLSRHVIREYVEEWVVGIEDYTARVRKIYDLLRSGKGDGAKRLYPVGGELGRRLLIAGQ